MVRRRFAELGHRLVRIFAPSAGQPDWLCHDESRSAQGDAGGDHASGFPSIRPALHAPADQAEFSLGGFMSARRGLFYVSPLNEYQMTYENDSPKRSEKVYQSRRHFYRR